MIRKKRMPGRRMLRIVFLITAAVSLFIAPADAAVGAVAEYGLNNDNWPNYITAGPDGNLWFTDQKPAVSKLDPVTGIIKEYSAGLNSGSVPDYIVAGPDGNLWFTDKGSTPAIGKLDPVTGIVTEYSAGLDSSSNLTFITAGPDGNLWFTDNGFKAIGRIEPATGAIVEYSTGSGSSDLCIVAAGPDGCIWFTDGGSSRSIGKVDPATGSKQIYTTGLNSYDILTVITAGPDGNMWFTAGGTTTRAVCKITSAGAITKYTAGLNSGSLPNYITAGPDGNLWFTDNGSTKAIGRIDPATGSITEYGAGVISGNLYNIVAGSDGGVWVVDYNNNVIHRVDQATGAVTSYATGLTDYVGPNYFLTAGPDGNLWFTFSDFMEPSVIGKIYAVVPAISAINPDEGLVTGGTAVTVTGTGFTGATSVLFGSTAAASFTVNSHTSITAVSPAHAAGTVSVTIDTPGGSSAVVPACQFTYADVSYFTVAFDSQGGSAVADVSSVTSGAIIGEPAAPTQTGYSFGGWYREASCVNAWNFAADTVTGNITLYAKWTADSSGGGNNGSGGHSNFVPVPKTSAKVLDSDGNIIQYIAAKLDGDTGTASFQISSDLLNKAYEKSAVGDEKTKTIVIDVPEISGAKAYEPVLPAGFLTAGDASRTVEIKTGIATVKVPDNMLTAADAAGAKNVSLTIASGDISGLNESIQEQVGERPVVELNLKIDGKQTDWSNEKAPVTVTISYKPTAAELNDPESIIIWYIDGQGRAVCVPNGHYDAGAGTVTFTASHFSCYAVNYNQVAFKDVQAGSWYYKAVSFIAARGITTGTENGNFDPGSKLTRGEFLVMLMRACGISSDENPPDNFADAGNTYYTGYLAVAKRLGIAAGLGNNLYAPNKEISRQEMFTLLYNSLKLCGNLPRGDEGQPLSAFSDADKIVGWAKEAMEQMAGNGIAGGSGDGKLFPAETATRAEMAQILYNLLSR